MKKNIQKQLLDLITTIKQGAEFALDKGGDIKQRMQMLVDCFSAVMNAEQTILKHTDPEKSLMYSDIIMNIKTELSGAYELLEGETEYEGELIQWFDELSEKISHEAVKLEILFLPYKSSMWDSMESIWRAAKDDERCECFVVPIPYFDRNPDRSLGKMHYEGENFPEDVQVIPFNQYDVASRRPDIVYIHNPYDDCNLVTSVHPDYYSFNLKKYTDMLVYVPYGISGNENDFRGIINSRAIKFVDLISAPSPYYVELMLKNGINPDKVKAFGSPKADKVIETCKNPSEIPQEWKDIIKNKKVILFNTSIAACLANEDWLNTFDNIIRSVAQRDDCVVIWRPHPLLENTISAMRPMFYAGYKGIEKYAESADNIIIDKTKDFYLSLSVSDALISDYSSVMFLYTITGKPILNIFDSSHIYHEMKIFDYYSDYFLDDGVSVNDFLSIVFGGEDTGKADRRSAVERSLINLDGTCGKKIHYYTIEKELQQ